MPVAAVTIPAVGDQITAAYGAQVATDVNSLIVGSGYVGDQYDNSGATTALPTTIAYVVTPGAAVTVTLASTRRMRVETNITFALNAAANGEYAGAAAYASGSSAIVGGTTIGVIGREYIPAALTGYLVTAAAGGTVLLAAGTWTFYPLGLRAAGGGATDTMSYGYVCVADAGPI